MIDTTLASDKSFKFQTFIKNVKANHEKIRDEKLQYHITENLEKNWDYHQVKYLTGEEILPSNQNHLIEHAKFAYSLLEKALKKNQQKNKLLF